MPAAVTTQSDAPAAAITPKVPWTPIAIFTALTAVLYAETFYRMAREWIELEEMGHGVFVPFVAAYVAWQKRDDILSRPIRPNWMLGVPLMLLGFLQLLLGHLGADFFIERTSIFPMIAGIILSCAGAQVLRSLLFPLAILAFMIRLPGLIYTQLTFPLQIFASTVAESALSLLGIPVLRDGNVLELANQKLSVVEACSGIRSLISLAFLSLIYAYFFDTKKWMRWVLLAASVPIAIFANSVRVTMTGILSEYKQELAEGFYHTAEGWVIFMVALFLLLLVHQVFNRIYKVVHHAG